MAGHKISVKPDAHSYQRNNPSDDCCLSHALVRAVKLGGLTRHTWSLAGHTVLLALYATLLRYLVYCVKSNSPRSSMEGALTSKGQVTVPNVIREYLGLKPGDRLKFLMHPDAAWCSCRIGPPQSYEVSLSLGGGRQLKKWAKQRCWRLPRTRFRADHNDRARYRPIPDPG